MPNIIEITDFHAPELDPYARLTQNQLRSRIKKKKGPYKTGPGNPAKPNFYYRLQQVSRNIAAVGGQLLQHGLVQPHVHPG